MILSVIGTGYVGLVTAVGLADFGNEVIGADIDEGKIEKLKKGISPIYEPGIEEYLKRNLKSGRLSFTSDIEKAIKDADVIFIAVGTPSKDDGNVDLSQVESVVKIIAQNLSKYKIIVTKSTVPVGINRWIYNTLREISGNNNFDVVSNPEFLREGKAVYDFFHPDKIVIGYENEKVKEIMIGIYRPLYLIETPFVFCNWETAELIKYANNAFLATKITFINQMANLAEEVGADVHIIAKAMGMDGRISPKFLHPGPGFGGSCFPKDTRALVKIGEKYNVDMSLVREVIRANENQKIRMVEKLKRLFNASNSNISGKTVTVLGLAFKAETDDMRESPAITIINELLKHGVQVKAHDPKAINNAKKIFGDRIEYFENEYEAAQDSDAIIIVTEWNEYRNIDLARLKKIMRGNMILDTRNVLDPLKAKRVGFYYEGVGRR